MRPPKTIPATEIREAILKRGEELKLPYNVIYHSLYRKANSLFVGVTKYTYVPLLESITHDYAMDIAKQIGATVPE